jgi:hypothetical protein
MLLDKQSLAKLMGKPIEEIRIGFSCSTFDLKGQTSVLHK